jgi:hypothetical protein
VKVVEQKRAIDELDRRNQELTQGVRKKDRTTQALANVKKKKHAAQKCRLLLELPFEVDLTLYFEQCRIPVT